MQFFCNFFVILPKNQAKSYFSTQMNKVSRVFANYIWLVDTIRRYQPISFEELNEYWLLSPLSDGHELDKRTLRRSLDAIDEIFDIGIDCGRGRMAVYRLSESGSLRGRGVQRWMLSTMAVAGVVRDARHLQERILLENVPSGDLMLTEVTRAMQSNHLLHIRYQKFVDSEPYEADVEPYCLKLFHQRWYLLAHRPERSYLAMYALDRMLSAVETQQGFTLPDSFDSERHFAHMFGVFQPGKDENAPSRVILRTFNGEWNYLQTLPLHSSQTQMGKGKTEQGEEYVDFKLMVYPTLDFKLELLSRITNIEILAPLTLRQDICEMLKKGISRNS